MFERYALPELEAAEREFLPSNAWWIFELRFNVAGDQYVPAIRVHDTKTEGVMMRWGLIPAWAEGKPVPGQTLWLKSNDIKRSIIYERPWLAGQRCILPAAGYYVWKLTDEKYRQPYFVHVAGRSVFGIAALWDRSVTEEDEVMESCSVVCVLANELLREVVPTHKRMPAILRRKDYAAWLYGTADEAQAVLEPYKTHWMHAYPVSPRVNSINEDDAGLVTPIT